MARDLRNRRSPSVFRRPGAQALPFVRPGKARSRPVPARAPSTPMRWVSTSASPVVARGSRAPCRAFSSANRGARRRPRHFRVTPSAPPRGARLPNVLPRHVRPCERKVLQVALPRRARPLGPEPVTENRSGDEAMPMSEFPRAADRMVEIQVAGTACGTFSERRGVCRPAG